MREVNVTSIGYSVRFRESKRLFDIFRLVNCGTRSCDGIAAFDRSVTCIFDYRSNELYVRKIIVNVSHKMSNVCHNLSNTACNHYYCDFGISDPLLLARRVTKVLFKYFASFFFKSQQIPPGTHFCNYANYIYQVKHRCHHKDIICHLIMMS